MNVQPGWEPLVVFVLLALAAMGVIFALLGGVFARRVGRGDAPPSIARFWGGFGAVLLVELLVVLVVVTGSRQETQYVTTYEPGEALSVTVDTPARLITVTVKDESHDCQDIPNAQIVNDGDEIRIAAQLATPPKPSPPCLSNWSTTVIHTNTALGDRSIVVEGQGSPIVLRPNTDGSYDPWVR